MPDQPNDNQGDQPAPERRSDPLATIGRGVVPPVLQDRKRRQEVGVPADEAEYGDYMIELNIQYSGGLRAAAVAFRALYEKILGTDFVKEHPPVEISKSYYQCFMSVNQWRDLLAADANATIKPHIESSTSCGPTSRSIC
jgi:hypothetical protein